MQLLAKQQKEWWKGLGEADEAVPGEERHWWSLLRCATDKGLRQQAPWVQNSGFGGGQIQIQAPASATDVLCVSRQDSCSER